MQENWIGKSQGLRFRFRLAQPAAGFDGFEVFTTRPDTLFGASFAAISPDQPLAEALARDNEALGGFTADCRATGTAAAGIENAETKGFDPRPSAGQRLETAWKRHAFVANF